MSESIQAPFILRSAQVRIGFYVVLILAICLRFDSIGFQSLWLDELWTMEIACGHDADHQLMPVNQILFHPPDLTSLASAKPPWRVFYTGMDRVTGPPGFYLLLRGWMGIFGQSEDSLRLLSALFSVLALVGFFLCVRESIGNEPALWAATIFAVAGPQIRCAQDTRPYALLMFEACVAILAVIRILRSGPSTGKSITLIFALFSLLFTHYFAIAVFFAMGAYGLITTTDRAKKNILSCVAIAGLIFGIAWGAMMWRQLPMFSTADRAAAFLHDSAPHHLRQTFLRVLTLPLSLICDIRPIPGWYAVGGLWYLLGIYLVVVRKINWLWPLLYLAIVGLLACLDVAHGTAHLMYLRYPLLASLPVYAMLAALIPIHPTLGRILCSASILLCLIRLPSNYILTNEDFRGFGQTIAGSTQKGDLIVFGGPSQTYAPQILYLAASYYAWPLPGPVVLIESPADPKLMEQLKTQQTLWFAADPTVGPAKIWLPGYHLVTGKSWPQVGSLLEMQRDP